MIIFNWLGSIVHWRTEPILMSMFCTEIHTLLVVLAQLAPVFLGMPHTPRCCKKQTSFHAVMVKENTRGIKIALASREHITLY